MKKNLFIAILLLLVALLATVTVWLLLQKEYSTQYNDGNRNDEAKVETQETITVETDSVTKEPQTESASSNTNVTLVEPIPLRNLPLSDTQRSLIETAGIDVETFVISPEMVTCAENTLGSERFSAIVAGDSPSFLEGTRLLGCIR